MLASTFSASQDQRHDPIADISLQSETHGLHVAPNIPSSPTNHITTPGQSSATRTTGQGAPGPRFQGWYRSLADPETYGLIHRGMMTRTHEGLRDPIEAGVITEGQAEVAFQIFKHHFAAVFPHPHFLRVRSKLPSHPFLRSACLFYTTRCSSHISIFNPAQVRRLETNLIDNINAYHYGCPPSFEGVMAAYILSLIPHDWTENSTGQPELEPTRTAGLAYGQAREIGSVNFERLLQTLRSGMPLKLIEDRVNQARLHLGVITRHLWLTISRCPWSVVSPLVHQTQRELLDFLLQSDSHSEVDQHVDVEYACLETIMKFSATWRQLETVETPMSAEVRSSTDIVRRLGREFDELRSKTAVSYARNVWFIYRLPTPILTAEVIDAWLDGMTEGLRTATEFIRQCLAEKWDLTTIPKACGTALVLSVLAISTGIIHYKHHFPELLLPGELDIEGVLREMQDYLSRCGHGLTMMLERSQENLEEYRIQILNQLVADDEYRYLVPENNVFGSQVDNEPGSGSGVLDLFSGLDTWWNWQLPQQPTADDNGPPAFLY
ncbi:hypothetical protein I302_102716 [Kwoniella bestiolae CBS 10118]|uniref:Transcription factor domain-containing protein n=1 Tax=Kwoniella bestiolae CBS 10118 TaxID=1296100 RepID=A0A1B9GFV3_9TREE|nr:hypothetical protein I302_01409 [Kwoniella bestiolae CBS 10118]OCF29896.1 hypothetical protein I302_01409 [Kwoniella bestiolae CBS 10118]